MKLELEGHGVIIAGSTRGIGLAIAGAFLREKARVTVTGRNADEVDTVSRRLAAEHGEERVLGFAGDLREAPQIDALLSRVRTAWTRIDHLVANVGSGAAAGGWRVDDEEWDRVLNMNLHATVRFLRRALPDLVEAGRGSVIAIGSIAGSESLGAPLPYGAAKAALAHYVTSVAREVGPSGVRVNCVAPGNVLFPGGSWERRIAERGDEVAGMLAREVPLRRFGTPDEIADAVVFLASERAAFITGTCVVVDGGQTRGWH